MFERGQPGQFQSRSVHDDLPELAHFRLHALAHDYLLLVCLGGC